MGQDPTVGPLYFGTFDRSMDAKKRVAIPSQWLSAEEDEVFYVIPHATGQYLIVLPPAAFSGMESEIKAGPDSADKKRAAIRKFYGLAQQVSTDKQGRILLSEKHCQIAGLAGEALFVGGRSRFEIWNKDRHAQNTADEDAAYLDVANTIGL